MGLSLKTITAVAALSIPMVGTLNSQDGAKGNEKNPAPIVKKDDNVKIVQTPKAPLPKLFQIHDFDKNGEIDINEAIEFYSDKAGYDHWKPLGVCNNLGYWRITKDETKKVAEWFVNVGNLKDTSIEEREICLNIAAKLNQFMQDKESIPSPLPRIFAKFDENNNGKIDIEEAFRFYEAATNTKLEKDAKGQVLPGSLRKVTDAFEAEAYPALLKDKRVLNNISTYSARHVSQDINHMLKKHYSKLYGSFPELKREPSPLINRD